MRALFSTSFTFKWYICVLLCGNVCIFSTLLSSCESRQNKPKRQRLCQSGWIILKWSWCIYSSFQNLQKKPSFPFPASKQHRESSFQTLPAWQSALGVGFPSLSLLLCAIWFRHGGQTQYWIPSLPDSKTEYLLLFSLHFIHIPE